MKLAVIGGGISGLVAAWLLHGRHQVTLFESADYVGGHTRTVDVATPSGVRAVDTGFVVYNEVTYPNFIRLLERLEVASQPTAMSFSVSCRASGLEYSGSSLNALFAQRRNILNSQFLAMLRDVSRFNRDAAEVLDSDPGDMTLGEFLQERNYGEGFRRHYLVPMGSAIWSSSPDDLLGFPAIFFLRFFQNHALLQFRNHHPWRVIKGGSRSYVQALTRSFSESIRLRTPVAGIRRTDQEVRISSSAGEESFDQVILAVHADQALRMLTDATPREKEILSQFPYQENPAVLHTDTALLPRSRRARASWNALIPEGTQDRAMVTYDMTRLQSLPGPETFCVSLGQQSLVKPEDIVEKVAFSHPVYTRTSLEAQGRHGEISGHKRSHFCGAYWGYGFHEDGVKSALAVCRYFGMGL